MIQDSKASYAANLSAPANHACAVCIEQTVCATFTHPVSFITKYDMNESLF